MKSIYSQISKIQILLRYQLDTIFRKDFIKKKKKKRKFNFEYIKYKIKKYKQEKNKENRF